MNILDLDNVLTNQKINNMKTLPKNPDELLISAMGKKSHDRIHFRSVIDIHDKGVIPGNATTYAKSAIARCFGIHAGELDSSDIVQCASDVQEALKLNKDLPIVQIAKGCYNYYCLKEFDEAIVSFNKASKMDPKNYKPLFYLAMVNKATGNWHDLQILLQQIDKFDIHNPLDLTNIGLCYEYLHDFDKAIKYHKKAIAVNPDWEAAYLNKFRALLLKNAKTSLARKEINKLIKITHEGHIQYQIMLNIYDRKYNKAYKEALNSIPYAFTWIGERSLYLGNLSKLLNDEEKAYKYFDCAIKELNLELNANPDNAEIHSLIGLAYAGKCNKVEAVEDGERAVKIAVTQKNKILESEMIINLAEIYTKLCMFDEAIKIVKDSLVNPSLFSTKILKLDPVWLPLLDTPKMKKIIADNNDKILTL